MNDREESVRAIYSRVPMRLVQSNYCEHHPEPDTGNPCSKFTADNSCFEAARTPTVGVNTVAAN